MTSCVYSHKKISGPEFTLSTHSYDTTLSRKLHIFIYLLFLPFFISIAAAPLSRLEKNSIIFTAKNVNILSVKGSEIKNIYLG